MRRSLRFSPILAVLLGAMIGFTVYMDRGTESPGSVQAPECLEGVTLTWVGAQRDGREVVCWIDLESPMIDRVVTIRHTSYVRFLEAGESTLRQVRGARVVPLAASKPVRVGLEFEDVPRTDVVSAVLDLGCTEVVFEARPVE